MTERLTSRVLVSALIRRTQAEGGFATVLHRGEETSGSIVLQIVERGINLGFFERVTDLSGAVQLVRCGPLEVTESSENIQYIERRTRSDPDIWVVELDIAEGQRLAAAILCTG